MPVTRDFRDLLAKLEEHGVRYLIIGAYAFGFHAKPRYTKDLDILVAPERENVARANRALVEFGSPFLLTFGKRTEVVQIGVEPNRIDVLQELKGVKFEGAWTERIRAPYGTVTVNWMGLDALILAKTGTGRPQDRLDVAVLKKVLAIRKKKRKSM